MSNWAVPSQSGFEMFLKFIQMWLKSNYWIIWFLFFFLLCLFHSFFTTSSFAFSGASKVANLFRLHSDKTAVGKLYQT